MLQNLLVKNTNKSRKTPMRSSLLVENTNKSLENTDIGKLVGEKHQQGLENIKWSDLFLKMLGNNLVILH